MSMYSIWNVQDIKTRDECIWHVNEMNLFDTWTLRPTQGGCVLYSKQGLSKSANSTVSLYQRVDILISTELKSTQNKRSHEQLHVDTSTLCSLILVAVSINIEQYNTIHVYDILQLKHVGYR